MAAEILHQEGLGKYVCSTGFEKQAFYKLDLNKNIDISISG